MVCSIHTSIVNQSDGIRNESTHRHAHVMINLHDLHDTSR